MVSNEKRGIAIISGISETLKYRKQNPDEEMLIKQLVLILTRPEFKKFRLEVMAAFSSALNILRKEPDLTDKQVLERIMSQITIEQ